MYNSHSDIWFAGAFAAITVDFIVYPFDTLKTRIQSPNYERVFKDARTGAIRRNVLYKGLYQGVWSVVFSTIPSSGAFFTTYEAVKCTLHSSSTHSQDSDPEYYQGSRIVLPLPFTHSLPVPVIHGIASSAGEMVSCLMLTPAEVIKQNAQMVDRQKSGSKVAPVRQVLWKFKGRPWKLWSGYTALVGRNLPMTGLQFPLFEYLRSRILDWRRGRRDVKGKGSEVKEQLIERAGVTGVSAGMAGTVASLVTTPIDVVKTRVMLSASSEGSQGQAGGKVKKGALAVGKEIFVKEGARGLFKGGAIRAGWTAIAVSLYLSMYEGGRFYLENRRKQIEGVGGVNEGDAVM